jgi:hypothetical protein
MSDQESRAQHFNRLQRLIVRGGQGLILLEGQQVQELELDGHVVGQVTELRVDLEAVLLVELQQLHRAVLHQLWLIRQPHRRVGLGSACGAPRNRRVSSISRSCRLAAERAWPNAGHVRQARGECAAQHPGWSRTLLIAQSTRAAR